MTHIVVVEPYDGLMETLSDVHEEHEAARGLGLPLAELAARLKCRVTVLDWNDWLRYETVAGAFPRWVRTPATRPHEIDLPRRAGAAEASAHVQHYSVPARDPDSRAPLAAGIGPRSLGLLANSDPLFLLAYCLDFELKELHRADPFDAVVLPMWGGLGYVAQLARATRVPGAVDVGYAVVVTDMSARRQQANHEGAWTRPALTRRQMEDVSLALADEVLTFGPRGDAIASAGRLPDASPPVRAPRRVPQPILDGLWRAARPAPPRRQARVHPFLHEPQDGASGVLVTLDAVTVLHQDGVRLSEPIVSTGPEMVFAPMKPRGFVEYWSSRGFVRELVLARQWQWAKGYVPPDDVLAVRLYPSCFDHLPSAWTELARGRMVLLSPAAAEGLAPGEDLPREALIQGEPDPGRLAASLKDVLLVEPDRLDTVRRRLCAQVAAAHSGSARARLLDDTVAALDRVAGRRTIEPDLGRIARLFVDRRQSLRALDRADGPATPSPPPAQRHRLTVVVTCYEMGGLLRETVESVWASTRRPDELLVVDDGSVTSSTREVIDTLEREAARRGLPLTVKRQPNRGLAAARNAGLAGASGELISFLDGDDLIEPMFYEIAAALLERYPTLGGVAAWALCFGDGVPDGFWNAPQPELPLLLVENPVIVPCMMHADTLRALGGYDVRQRYNYEDWELSLRLVASGHPIVTIPRYLQRYRVRATSLFRTMTDVQNQAMRELMLDHHRETVARFGVETAMLLEHQLAKHLYAAPPPSPNAGESRQYPRRVFDDIRRTLARTTGALVRGTRR